jgi:hypothetical protein
LYTIPSEAEVSALISKIPLGMGGFKAYLPLTEEDDITPVPYYITPERFRHLLPSESDLELDTSNDLSAEGSFEQYDNSFDSG